MKTKKIVFNWFIDFDKEERWLNEMSRQGWCLWHADVYFYRFKRSEPGEFIFQIDFDEDYINKSNEDYVNFRSSCGDIFVHECDSKIYWKRKAADGPFDNNDNVTAKLRLAYKAFNLQFKSLTGIIYTGAVGILLLPILKLLPECGFTKYMTDLCRGLPIVIILVAAFVQLPMVIKILKKMDELVKKTF
ncbi:MAG: DUF2812 domain-containing protein [Candidatus Cryptobacteroides sp.]